ncbi:hypothetical protein [Cupriavidus sp. RAF12]|uniref:hypothetical protein n=1 Tax=Cupriavidus sp. RAF12 TaxID=3233050 RepID=UPI003F921BE5
MGISLARLTATGHPRHVHHVDHSIDDHRVPLSHCAMKVGRPGNKKQRPQAPFSGSFGRIAYMPGSVHEQPNQNQHKGRYAEKPREDVRHDVPPNYL